MAKLPLEGIRVADHTAVWAGPFGTLILADLGAEVIRVEPIDRHVPFARGSVARPPKAAVQKSGGYPDRDPGERPWNRSASMGNCNANNKLSMTVNIHRPGGMEIYKRLLKTCDVVYENSASDVFPGLGITYEMLREVKPDIIYLRAPAWGTWGPHAHFKNHGASLETALGFTTLRGYTDIHPSENGSTFIADFGAGAQGALAVLMALNYRRRTGKGQLIELSQAENALPVLGPAILDYTMNGRVQGPTGNRDPWAAPQGCYPTKGDDQWLTISIHNDEEWRALVRVMGDPPWAAEFADSLTRWRRHDELDQLIGQWTAPRDNYALMHILQREGVPAGIVLNDRDVFDDPHMKDQDVFPLITHPEAGTHRYPGVMFRMSQSHISVRRPPPCLGEHNEYCYKELLGYSTEEYAELERMGHIGKDYPPHVMI